MSLLDSVLGSVLGGNSNSGNSSLQGALLQAVISQMLGGGQQGGSGGALGNIVGSMLGGGNQASGGALGNILGSVLGGSNQSGGGALGNILGSVLGGGAQAHEQAGTQMAGGLGNLTDMLSQLGLGDQVKSWVSTGENLPVTAEQIQNTLGQNGTLGQIASQAGVSETDAAGGLAELLPGLINKLTPNGQVNSGDITSILGSLLSGNK